MTDETEKTHTLKAKLTYDKVIRVLSLPLGLKKEICTNLYAVGRRECHVLIRQAPL